METTVGKNHIWFEQRNLPEQNQSVPTLVLFLHGWGSFGASFGRLLDVAGETLPVVSPDLPGFGASDEPDQPWSVDDYADFVISFLAKWNPKKVILIAHSYGGRISIKLAARSDLPFVIDRIVLLDSAGILPKRGLKYKLKVSTYKIGKAILSWKPVRVVFPNALDEFKAGKGSSDYASASPIMKAALVKAVNEDLRPLLPSIKVPVLLIWGDKDTATPLSDARIMESEIPDAGLVVLEGAGHFSFVDQPTLSANAIRYFLQSVSG